MDISFKLLSIGSTHTGALVHILLAVAEGIGIGWDRLGCCGDHNGALGTNQILLT